MEYLLTVKGVRMPFGRGVQKTTVSPNVVLTGTMKPLSERDVLYNGTALNASAIAAAASAKATTEQQVDGRRTGGRPESILCNVFHRLR